MPLLKDFRDFRRQSKAILTSPTPPPPPQGQPLSVSTNASFPTNRSSSTVGSFAGLKPQPAAIPPRASSPHLPSLVEPPALPPRPAQNNRLGSNDARANGPPPIPPKPSPATSPYAPRLLSIVDNSWVHQKVLLVYGQVGDAAQQAVDGNVIVHHHQDNFPPTAWPACDSHFKALVHLTSGLNRLRFDFAPPKPAGSSASGIAHSSFFTINYLPLLSTPPLQLAILVAKDSPLTFDAPSDRIQREGNSLETAVRKYRMAAYLWQTFTAEQMYRNRFGRRCFRFEEEWQTGTLALRDHSTGQMRNEARIHIIRTNKTVAELRDLDIAQQYGPASRKSELFSITMDAVRDYFKPAANQKQYVAALILDSHWDPDVGTIRGHAALGGGGGDIQLAIFGSHALHSYPSSIEEVAPAFSDCTRTDERCVANDCCESGSTWEAANIGIGAHLHECGHLFGCPHQEHGVMARDYVRLNRTFTCREPFSTRTKARGLRLCLPKDECAWHRLDCLRFRHHPCFRLPQDAPLSADDSVQVWAVGNGSAVATAAAGVAFIELYAGDDICRSHIEFVDSSGNGGGSSNGVGSNGGSGGNGNGNGSGGLSAGGGLQRQVPLNEAELRARLPEDRRDAPLRLEVHAASGGSCVVDDFAQLTRKAATVKLPNGGVGFRSSKLGFSQMKGTRPQEVILGPGMPQSKLLTQVKVYHGFAVDGLEFVFEDYTSQLFGNRGGKPGGSEFNLDTRRGETIIGFYLRAGVWIDGIEILTSLGRRSGVFGNPSGGSGHSLIPPRGYSIVGISGTCGDWVDGFSLIIAR